MSKLDNENIIHKIYDDIEIIQFKKLLEFPNLIHGYTLRKHGINISSNNKKVLKESYNKISKIFNIDETNIIKPHQTHTDIIEVVKNPNIEFNEVDGLITDKNNILLVTTSADCISLLFYDKRKNLIADVHSGWRGTAKKIGKKAVIKMIKEYSSNPEDIICAICPSIRKCHFEVDTDVMEIFKKEFEYTGRINEIISVGRKVEEKQKYNIDTVLINKILLEEAGLKKENIIDSGICTVCNSDCFHSYRVDKQESGRNGALIRLK